jgi:serine/threonine protein phosphatase PrpC
MTDQHGNDLVVGEARLGWTYGCCRRGASHRKSNTPCQDAYGIVTGSASGVPYLALAVADGHGDKKHDLSQYGAALAVKTALEEMQMQMAFLQFGTGNGSASLSHHFREDFARRVVHRWRKLALDDAKERVGEESSTLETQLEIYKRYGTTLLTALVAPDVVLTSRIGDGDVLLVRPAGEIEKPFRDDSGLLGSQTHSLSSSEAHLHFQTEIFRDIGECLLLIVTDGLSDSYQDEQGGDAPFRAFAKSLRERVATYGMDKVGAALPNWLDGISERGSGDDITLALVYALSGSGETSAPSADLEKTPTSESDTHAVADRQPGPC